MHAVTLREAAERVLRANDRGTMTVAAPRLYPHQWSWDAAFVAIGWAALDVRRAAVELESLLAGQWRTGMIPHIVFDPGSDGYFPGASWWRSAELTPDAPAEPATSGICQPPVHAIALAEIVTRGPGNPGGRKPDTGFRDRVWPKLLAWHRFLVRERRDPGSGLIAIVHGWESGLDNSPRFDAPYAAVRPGPLPPYTRTDNVVVADGEQRPTATDYDRYLWLVDEMQRAGYDSVAIAATGSFRVGDVLFTALLALACEALAEVAPPGAAASDLADLSQWAEDARAAVVASISPATGLAHDIDIRAGVDIDVDTIAGFAPLLCGGAPAAVEARLLALFDGPNWCGHPSLTVPAPPSTTPSSPAFERRRYWRGPIWPFATWLFGWAFARRGLTSHAAAMRDAGLRLVADCTFAEYYEPFTGEPLGSPDQSWTAAAALDWLAHDNA